MARRRADRAALPRRRFRRRRPGSSVLTGPSVEPILTGRLFLEPLRVEHAEEMLPVLAAPELYVFIGGKPPTLPELRARYRQMLAGPPAGPSVGWLNWVIRQRQDQHLAGTVQATVWAGPAGAGLRASVAWMVGATWQGHGIATEAARALVAWLHGHRVATITATIHPGNAASAVVARRAGLAPTTEMMDDEIVWVTPP